MFLCQNKNSGYILLSRHLYIQSWWVHYSSFFIKFFIFYTGMTQVYLFSDLCRVMMEQLFKKFQMYDFLPVLIVMYITKFKLSIANLIQVFFISIVNTYVHYRLIYYHFGRSFSSNFYLINTTSSLIDSLNC